MVGALGVESWHLQIKDATTKVSQATGAKAAAAAEKAFEGFSSAAEAAAKTKVAKGAAAAASAAASGTAKLVDTTEKVADVLGDTTVGRAVKKTFEKVCSSLFSVWE